MSKPTLALAIVTKNEIYSFTMACILELINNPKLATKVHVKQNLCMGQSDLPKARSIQLTKWYDTASENDIFMFIDADQVFLPDDIALSLQFLKTYDVVCGAYPRKTGEMTLEPKDYPEFCRNKEGELYYGATGFMMMTFNIVDRVAKHLGQPIMTSKADVAFPFFFERIVTEAVTQDKQLWLGEDYSFCWLVRQLGGVVYGYVSPTIGHILTLERFVTLPHPYKWPEKSVVIYCGLTSEPWCAKNLEKGIGGSETAVIHLSKYWSKQGYNVTVFCLCEEPAIYDGVNYRNIDEFRFTDTYNILIIWRAVGLLDVATIHARKCILDLHDVVHPEQFTPKILKNVDVICVKSEYHKSMLGNVDDTKIAVIPNGGYCERDKNIEKDPNYLIYTSSYDRGLLYMLKWGWPEIKKYCPNAYLKIFYGWNGYDATNPKTEDVLRFKNTIIELMKQDGVQECGRIPNSELLLEKNKASIHYYIGNFQEIDCISIRESASLGVIPIVSSEAKVFLEKPYCITVDGDPTKRLTQINGAKTIIDLLNHPEKMEEARLKSYLNLICRENLSEQETWENTAKEWLKLF